MKLFAAQAVAFCTLVLAMAPATFGAAPETISYQGYLTDAAGNPVNGTVSMTFRLYSSGTSTTALWSQTTSTVNVTNGVYSVALGTPPTPFNLPFDAQYFLGVSVGADAEMTPRTRLRSSPYAIRSVTAENATNLVSQTSTSHIANLNADMVDGQHASTFSPLIHLHADTDLTGIMPLAKGGTGSGTKNFVDLTGHQTVGGIKIFNNPPSSTQFVSTAGTGTAPFQVASTTMVPNLNAEMVGGKKLPELDARYGLASPPQNPRANILSTVDSTGNVGNFASMTISADGLPFIAYYDGTNGDLKVVKCGDAACSAGNAIVAVDTGGDVGRDISMTIGTDGLPVIAYYDATNGDLKVAKCGTVSCSSGNTISVVDSGGDVGRYASIAVRSDYGFPVISYYDATNKDLKIAWCGDAACSSVTSATAVDSSGDVGTQTSIALRPDGTYIVSYYDSTNMALKVLPYGEFPIVVDDITGTYSSITIGNDGLPIIAYGYGLKVAKCGNLSCSSGNIITTLIADTTYDPSITIGTDGLPLISFMLPFPQVGLRVARCGNTSCSSGSTIAMVDAGGDIGYSSSMTIGPDGLPIISYFDLNNGDLKVAKCVNQFCLSNWTRR